MRKSGPRKSGRFVQKPEGFSDRMRQNKLLLTVCPGHFLYSMFQRGSTSKRLYYGKQLLQGLQWTREKKENRGNSWCGAADWWSGIALPQLWHGSQLLLRFNPLAQELPWYSWGKKEKEEKKNGPWSYVTNWTSHSTNNFFFFFQAAPQIMPLKLTNKSPGQ